jgi:predicted PurR-regulated permease PerM
MKFLTRWALLLTIIVFTYLILNKLQFYFVPVSFAALFAALMLPVCRRLERDGFPRILAIFICLIFILLFVGVLAYFISTQVNQFVKQLPDLKQQVNGKLGGVEDWFEKITGYDVRQQPNLINGETDKWLSSAESIVGTVLAFTGTTIISLGLFIVHFILFLLYRTRIRLFLFRIVPEKSYAVLEDIMSQASIVTQQYLLGIITVMTIMAVLNSAGLMILGIPNAIFFGIFASVLNVIPYIGIWLGSILPFLMALIIKDEWWQAFFVIGVFAVTHFLDSNFLTPRITGSRVKVNALATFAAIVVGEVIWGIAGMILFIPLLGTLKVIFDRVPELQPIGYLIGDEKEESRLAKMIESKLPKRKTTSNKKTS